MKRTVLVTGSEGFIGSNLVCALDESESYISLPFTRADDLIELERMVGKADVIIHLAGENRPSNDQEYDIVNYGLTKKIVDLCVQTGNMPAVVFASSTQAIKDNPYGRSKLKAEECLVEYSERYDIPVTIMRLPGVFGKWVKPNYNSVVATFCYNISNNIPINVVNPAKVLELVYIDDLIKNLLSSLEKESPQVTRLRPEPCYQITVSELADTISEYQSQRESLAIDVVNPRFGKLLYSTFCSYLPKELWCIPTDRHTDDRGTFTEFVKSNLTGQVSLLTCMPGRTRGGHYHHTKMERFLILRGEIRFDFEHIRSRRKESICVSDSDAKIVETIVGWTHSLTNTGDKEAFIAVWANEIFNGEEPDTFTVKNNNE